MKLQLISKKECPYCWQVKIALHFYGISYDLDEWILPDKAFLAQFSPQSSTPTLLVDKFPIWDSVAIIYYLEDISSSDKSLFPGSQYDRAKGRLLHIYNNSVIGKSLREVIFEKRNNLEIEWNMSRIKRGEEGWRKSLDWLESKMEGGFGNRFSIVDVVLLPRFILAERYGVGVGEGHPKLFNWFNKLKQQDVYHRTFL